MIIKTDNLQFQRVEALPWHVGPLKRQEVSKGLRIKISLPQIKKDDLLHIINVTKANSWVVRVSRKSNLGKNVLGSVYIPIKSPGTRSSKVKQLPSGYTQVFFASAAISKRFENLNCPAFKHNLIIDKIREHFPKEPVAFKISPGIEFRNTYKVRTFDYKPFPFNGGKSLKGIYTIELALYNYKTKMIKSNKVKVPGYFEILEEKELFIKGCKDFKPALREIKRPVRGKKKKFKFNR